MFFFVKRLIASVSSIVSGSSRALSCAVLGLRRLKYCLHLLNTLSLFVITAVSLALHMVVLGMYLSEEIYCFISFSYVVCFKILLHL